MVACGNMTVSKLKNLVERVRLKTKILGTKNNRGMSYPEVKKGDKRSEIKKNAKEVGSSNAVCEQIR